MKESTIQSKFTKWLDERGIKWTKSISNSKAGDSDLTVCYYGKYVACEVKRPGEMPTELQTEKLWLVHLSGGMAFYADNLQDFVQHIEGNAVYNLVQNWKDSTEPEMEL